MKKSYLFVVLLILITVAAFGSIWVVQIDREEKFRQFKQQVAKPSLPTSDNVQVEYLCVQNKTALDVLQTNYTVETSDSTLGKLVTSINDIKQGNGKYWLYSIDSKEATVGASLYKCQGNEKIVWELK